MEEQRMPDATSDLWEEIRENGFIPLCGDFEADGSETVCDVLSRSGFGAPECISCRRAYRRDDKGNIEYYR